VKSGRVSKKKTVKSQLKISSFFSPKQSRGSSPDSGISSRPESPEDDEGDSTEEADEQSDQVDDQQIKDDFMKSLEDSDDDDEDDEDDGSDWEDDGREAKWAKNCRPAAKKARRGVPAPAAAPLPVFHQQPKSEYELKRDKQMKEMEAMLSNLKSQWVSYGKKVAPKPKERNYTFIRRAPLSPGDLRRSGRSSGAKVDYKGLEDDNVPARVKRESTGIGSFDESEFRFERVQKRAPVVKAGRFDPNVNVLMPEDVTEAMIGRISAFSGRKKYCSATGTCCHQCRQKTVDQKTVCRSGHCRGYVGMFCGPCLNNRYGESVAEALKDPNWACPVCREICNCSFCLSTPTGQLYNYAQSRGFKSAHHYLVHLRERWDQEDQEDSAKSEAVEANDEVEED